MMMKIAVICGMSEEKVRARLQPLIHIDQIETIYLVRRYPIDIPKVINYSPPSWMVKILLFAEFYRILALFYICLTKHPDILYGIYFVPHGIYATLAGWVFRKSIIQELIGTDRLKVMRSKFLLRLLKYADYIGVRGKTSKEQLIEFGISKGKLFTSTAVNVLDFKHFKPDDSAKIYDLIYCGRMDKNKQLEILINAIAELTASFPDIKMVFVGDGPERRNLKSLTEAFDLQANISFAGKQPYEKMPIYLNQSKIFVMSSAFEGLPVAMLEALSCGLPVVMPDVGDIKDVAKHGVNAYMICENQTSSFVEGLCAILGDQDLYASLQKGALETRERFLQEYSLQSAIKRWKEIISKLQ
jgi:glycosyltransferase involved in cell wall biosynthesis